MTEQEIREKLREGFQKANPKVAEMINIIMDVYQEGFNTCWKLFTGQDFSDKEE